MKTLTFNYTKKDGSTSERTLLALVTPSKSTMYAGIDISSLSPEDGAEFVGTYEALHEEFLEKAKVLQERYDLKHNYRQFLESGMSEIIEI